MDIKEKAKLFAIKAHLGQVRKNEHDMPMIMHPIGVASLLQEYGFDDNVVAAGYLYDVIEDTKYTYDDIKENFGDDIASLVMGATEPDKSLSWKERKTHTIDSVKTLSLRNKAIICADKINNLEDLMIIFQKTGKRDFSNFKRGEDEQRWYYTEVYNSLVSGEDENAPIFKRFKDVLDIVFYNKENTFLRNTIFVDSIEYYEKLKKLHAQKLELKKLRDLCVLAKPFIVEFTGTPRTGKTTTINNIYDFFKKGGFDVKIVEEFTTSKYYKEVLKKKFEKLSVGDRNIAILEQVYTQLLDAVHSKNDIVLIDRSLNDRQIWNHRRYCNGDFNEEEYMHMRDKYSKLSKELIDFLVVTYADDIVSLRRDYYSSMALEERTFLNLQNISEYNDSLHELKELFNKSVDTYILVDTNDKSINDGAIQIVSKMMPKMRKKYIENFKSTYNL